MLSCLGGIYGELLSHWYVEAIFSTGLVEAGQIFPVLEQSERHVERQVA